MAFAAQLEALTGELVDALVGTSSKVRGHKLPCDRREHQQLFGR